MRLPPSSDPVPLALAACARGQTLVLAPTQSMARRVGLALRRAGVPVALHPRDWAMAAAGATVVGTRAAAWSPAPNLAAVVVLDEHDEAWQEERAPTWHAREVAVERARRAGVPCVLASPVPSLEALDVATLVPPSRSAEREGWALVDVIDRRNDDPLRGGLWSERITPMLRDAERAVCVLNRTGRSRLLACGNCGEVARCEHCDGALVQAESDRLRCGRCDAERPVVCQGCGATRLRNIRAGVTRAREELEALVGEPVVEVTGASDGEPDQARIYVGTEAALHRVDRASLVVFLDFDQELLAPRYRAGRAGTGAAGACRSTRRSESRWRTGGRADPGARHEVIQAALTPIRPASPPPSAPVARSADAPRPRWPRCRVSGRRVHRPARIAARCRGARPVSRPLPRASPRPSDPL
jgi:primosomal protein N' (replication factor Y) (superfamily II helicase)